ncbi:MAG TPA: GreA/GreB family elongation factor [Thermoanaerobaculia bacterium]|nr:GreA/GreB family elongation factor [Thermoanaerobaculia bacterium]
MTREQILITKEDKKRLLRVLPRLGTEYADREDLVLLAEEIERAVEIDPDDIPADVVTLNSTARVTDLESGASMDYTVVMPGEANYDAGKISVLAPLGTALLGYRVGDEIEWEVPRGVRRLRIDAVLYQPEAASHSGT